MLCTKCGKTVPEESQFCPFCGTELERAAAPAPAPPPEATVPLQPQQPQPPPPTPPPQYAAPPQRAQASGSSTLIAVLVAAVFMFLVLGGIGAYLVIKKLGTKPPAETPAEVTGTSATETPTTAGPTTERTDETPATGSSTSRGAAPEDAGSAASGTSLDALVGEWQVDIAQLDGPPPTTLTIRRSGDEVEGTLNDRINTHLNLAVVNGEYEGTWTDPQVGTVAAEALLMPEGTLEIFVLDGSGGADLLISACRGGDS